MRGPVVALMVMLSVAAASAGTAGFTLVLLNEKVAELPVCVSGTLMSPKEYQHLGGQHEAR